MPSKKNKNKRSGLPHSTHHDVNDPTAIPISGAAPPPPSNLLVANPNTSNPPNYGHINHPHTTPAAAPPPPSTLPNTTYHPHHQPPPYPPYPNTTHHPHHQPPPYPPYPNTTYYPHHQPPPYTHYRYQSQQDDHRESGREEWEVNTGNSVNKTGTQKGGDISAKNGSFAAESAAPPRNVRFVLNTGGNTNEGDLQQSGNIEFVNGNVGFRGNPTAISPC